MRTTFTYEGILSAVGRVLDESGVKRFAIQEDDDGLIIEGKNGAGGQMKLHYSVGDLYELVTRDEAPEQPSPMMVETEAETLHRFLAEHRRELIGAAR